MKRSAHKATAIRVIIVDDHPVVRRGLRACLEEKSQFEVVAEAANGRDAIEQASALQPDLMLVDINMPGMDGLQVCEAVRPLRPSPRVVILSIHNRPEYVQRALAAGACGYLLKDIPAAQLVEALERVYRGEVVLSPQVTEVALNQWMRRQNRSQGGRSLSRREQQVVTLIARGFSNKEIAQRLGVSVRTVETHRERVMTKLNLRNVAAITRYAIAEGLIPLEENSGS
ncbi:MAG: response regulator transcription factor [Verrucomicrobiota bacterium]|nr:response regulator transcription factor [Limisphaera sp.]MDW8382598.1 response regulator transcription factor [Verrucomicrobiota bacterium]